jgi:phosphoenolpyruvate carboxykinase (ATP)
MPHRHGLENHLIYDTNNEYWDLGPAALIEHAISRREGLLGFGGPFVVSTGQHTGRSPKNKFVVEETSSAQEIWWGVVNVSFPEDKFDSIHKRLSAYLQGKDLFVQDCWAGADPRYRIPIRAVNEYAWHNLFARRLFIRPELGTTENHRPQ